MKKAIIGDRDQVEGRRGKVEGDLLQESGIRVQETVRGIQNSKFRIQNTSDPETVNCQLKLENSKVHVDLTHGKSYLATEVVKKAITTYLKSLKTDFEKAEKEQYSFKIIATEQEMNCTIDVDQNPIQLKGVPTVVLRKRHIPLWCTLGQMHLILKYKVVSTNRLYGHVP